jgi:hypothetical protein
MKFMLGLVLGAGLSLIAPGIIQTVFAVCVIGLLVLGVPWILRERTDSKPSRRFLHGKL